MEEKGDKEENIQEEKISREKQKEDEDAREKKNLEKFRINFLSFKTSQPITDLKTLCPICCSIPDINLSLNPESGHHVKCMRCRYCYCCSHPRSKTLDDYISIMAKMHQENIKCDIHKEKGEDVEAYFSCELCQKWMCEDCINNHINEQENEIHNYYIIRKAIKDSNSNTFCRKHNLEYSYYVVMDFALGFNICKSCQFKGDGDDDIFYINKEKGQCFFNQLKEIIKNGVDYLDIYCKNIYEKLLNSIKDNPDLTKKSKEIYDKSLINNRRALFYFQMVVNTGIPSISNYNLIENCSNALFTKFDRLNFEIKEKLSKEQIDKTLNFFENNYIVGFNQENLEDLKDKINIKELYNVKKEIEKKNIQQQKEGEEKEKENKDEEENEKIKFIDIVVLNENIIIGGAGNGEVHIFELDNSNLKGKCILSQKVHEKSIISLDKIKDKKNTFVTCDEKQIKIWGFYNKNNIYSIDCETVLKDFSKSDLVYLYVLNKSNNISFINEDNKVIILNNFYKSFFDVNFQTSELKALYQIESNDDNNNLFIVGSSDNIIFYKISGEIEYIGYLSIGCYSAKSFCYLGNNKLLIGGKSVIYLIDVKNVKLERIIKMRSAECSCFLRYNNMTLCGYADTSICHLWSNGIAQQQLTRFLLLENNNGNLENHFIEDVFNIYGITNALWIDKDKFISCFYNDDSLKIFQIK